jgi:hypothetical protein
MKKSVFDIKNIIIGISNIRNCIPITFFSVIFLKKLEVKNNVQIKINNRYPVEDPDNNRPIVTNRLGM